MAVRLRMLRRDEYLAANRDDPIGLYFLPLVGPLYRRRVELCLGELKGGQRVLEVGFGSGIAFLNLAALYAEIHGIDRAVPAERVSAVFERRGVRLFLRQGDLLDTRYPDNHFDAVFAVSVLEHLRPENLDKAFLEIGRIVKSGGQVVYGVPVERPLMAFLFRCLGHNIREHHFSTERDIAAAARRHLREARIISMAGMPRFVGRVYQVGHFTKP